MNVNKTPKPTDEEVRHAVATLSRLTADDAAVDRAFGIVLRASAAHQIPPSDFTHRTMLAVRRAPLPQGRLPFNRSLESRPLAIVLAATAVATAAGALVTLGPVALRILARAVALLVPVSVSAIAAFKGLLNLWPVISIVGTAVAKTLASSDVAFVLTATSLLGVLSLTTLARLLASEQELSRW